jgi:hypothetical protein
MRRIMLALSKRCILFRNQSGFYIQDGRPIRYGIANPGGADLIGWTPIEITPDMIGQRVAIFTALEVKTEKGRPTKEQLAFIEAVKRAGGIAEIVRSEDDAKNTVDVFTTR